MGFRFSWAKIEFQKRVSLEKEGVRVEYWKVLRLRRWFFFVNLGFKHYMELVKGSKQQRKQDWIESYMFDATPGPHFAKQISHFVGVFFCQQMPWGLQDTACAVFRFRIQAGFSKWMALVQAVEVDPKDHKRIQPIIQPTQRITKKTQPIIQPTNFFFPNFFWIEDGSEFTVKSWRVSPSFGGDFQGEGIDEAFEWGSGVRSSVFQSHLHFVLDGQYIYTLED